MENKPLSELGIILRDCRESIQLNQKELANRIAISPSYLNKIENGNLKKPPSTKILGDMVAMFQAHNVHSEKIRQILELSGINKDNPDWFAFPPKNTAVIFINGQIGKLPEKEDQNLLGKDLINLTSLSVGIIGAEKKLGERDWDSLSRVLPELEKQLDQLRDFDRRVYSLKGYLLYSKGLFADSIHAYSLALTGIQNLKRSPQTPDESQNICLLEADIYIRVGDCERRLSHWEQAKSYYESAKEIFSSTDKRNNRIGVAICYRKIAAIENYIGSPQAALKLLDLAEEVARREKDEKSIYKIMQHRGWSYRLMGRWDESIEQNKDAFALMVKVTKYEKNDREKLRSFSYLGDSYRIARRYHDAKDCYEQAIKILDEIERSGKEAKLHRIMVLQGYGQVLKNLKMNSKAAEKFNECRRLAMDMDEELRLAQAQNELGNLELESGNLVLAKFQLEYSAETFKRLKSIFSYYISLVDLCKVNFELGDYPNLHQRVKEAINEDNGNVNFHLARIYFTEAKALIKEERVHDALQGLIRALEKAHIFNTYCFEEINNDILKLANDLVLRGQIVTANMLYEVFDEFIQKQKLDKVGIMEEYSDKYRKNKERISILQQNNAPSTIING